MKKILVLSLMLLVALGCAGRSKKAKLEQEERETANVNKPIVLVLTTGDRIEGKIMRETPEAITILGKGGDGTFPMSLILRTEEPKRVVEAPKPKPPEPEPVPVAHEPAPFAAIRGKQVFHKAACPLLKNQPRTKIVDYSTRKEATEDGLRPCGTCNP